MELNKLSFAARYRSPSQVFDLTLLFVKENLWSMSKIYLCMLVPVALLAYLVMPLQYASLLVWWLKPLFERPLLDFLAKRTFSAPTSTWSCLKSVTKLRLGSVLLMLTLHRLSPNRAFLSAVDQLEKQRGDKARKRKNLLSGRYSAKQTWWMFCCLHMEMLVLFGLGALIYAFVPQGVNLDEQFLYDSLENGKLENIYWFLYLPSIAIVAPYFTTGGFLMYLNSRIKLEAWDIELSFKQIANKYSKVVASIFFACVLLQPNHQVFAQPADNRASLAAEKESQNKYAEDMRKLVADIYEDNELIATQKTWEIVPKKDKNLDSHSWPNWINGIIDFFRAVSKISPIIGYLAWAMLILLVGWLCWLIYKHGVSWGISNNSDEKLHSKLPSADLPSFFADVVTEDWPQDLISAALKAITQGNNRLALSYTLRHVLLFADQHCELALHSSMTENECKKAVLSQMPRHFHEVYDKVFYYWMLSAWAHQEIEPNQIREIVNVCGELSWSDNHEAA